MSPAITMPLSSTRSRTSARFDGAGPYAGRSGAPPRTGASVRSLIVARSPGVPSHPPVADQLAARVGPPLAQAVAVGGPRDPPELDHLDLDGPAVVGLLEPGDPFGLAPEELDELLGRLARHLHGRERRLGAGLLGRRLGAGFLGRRLGAGLLGRRLGAGVLGRRLALPLRVARGHSCSP